MAYPPGGEQGQLIEAIQALAAKRQPLEQRLRAIEQNKQSTAPQIYQRVKQETEEQLSAIRVEEALRHAEASRLRDQLSAQLSSLERRRQDQQDALEEIRFRNTLGEFTPDAFAAAGAEHAKAGAEITAQLEPVKQTLAVLGSFLASVQTARAATATAAASAPPPPAAVRPPAVQPPSDSDTNPNQRPISEIESLFGSQPVRPQVDTGRADAPRPAPPVAAPPPPAHRPTVADLRDETTGDVIVPKVLTPSAPRSSVTRTAFQPAFVVAAKDKDRGEEVYELAGGQTLIGRAPENDIILLEESVSRRHARLLVEGDECKFEDLGSANGSYINGERMRPREARQLKHADIVKLGQLMAKYRAHPD